MGKSESTEARARAIARALQQAFLSEQRGQTGAEFAADLLQQMSRTTRNDLLTRLRNQHPSAYQRIVKGG